MYKIAKEKNNIKVTVKKEILVDNIDQSTIKNIEKV